MKQIVIPVILNAVEDDLPRDFVDDLGKYLSDCIADYVEDYGAPVDMSITVCRPALETVQ